jgi:transketolase N-terminal domain/subunit
MLNKLERRVVELTYEHGLTHLSSCLNCVNLIADIYFKRKDDEPFVLGNGHAGLALYVVLESAGLCDAEEMVKKHGVHPSRDMEHGIWCSSGSLGQAETVAVGMALANPKRTVWLVTSDGSCMEGATLETIRVGRKNCPNLNIHCVFNGYGAYSTIILDDLPKGIILYTVDYTKYPSWLRGLQGHYLVLNEKQYSELMS